MSVIPVPTEVLILATEVVGAYCVTFPDGSSAILRVPKEHSMTPDEQEAGILNFANELWNRSMKRQSQSAGVSA